MGQMNAFAPCCFLLRSCLNVLPCLSMNLSLYSGSLILFTILLFSCNDNKLSSYEERLSVITDTISNASFSESDTLKFVKTGFKVNDVHTIAIADTFILLSTAKSRRAVTVLSTETYKPVAEIIPRDRGKGHCLSVTNIMNTDEKDVVWLYDGAAVKFLKVDLQKAIKIDNYEGEKEFVANKPGSAVMSPSWINDSMFAGCSYFSDEERFVLFNDSFRALQKIGVLPPALSNWPEENPKGKFSLRAMCYSGDLVKHPEMNKYAIAYKKTSRVELYDSSNLVKVIRGPDLFDPLYEFQDIGAAKMPKHYKETMLSCIEMQADSKFIYVLYSGRKKRFRFGHKLLIFDWNGNPVKLYDLPGSYQTFSIIQKGNHTLIYAVSYKANELEYSEISI